MIGGFPDEKIALLERLSKQQRIALLSNTNELHMVQVKRAWEKSSALVFESLFEQVFLSHEIQQRKPDVATFHWVCQQLEVMPEKVLFIDDSPQHIAGAISVGLQTHFYENPLDFYALFS
jgi:putative hydrolase of the HAD superfamily